GQNLGPYRILEQTGKGGMATVYKAYQASMNRHVAVKVLPPHFMQDPMFAERFEREAHTIARLEHPHILPVHDYGQADDGTTYIAMRYVESGTLSDILRQGPISLAETTRYFEQIADALAYAHEQGVIHRDMKPSNVLVDQRGQAFLTDFGLARMVEGGSQLTGSMIMGTPTYMAPELGEGKPADERSDIYALGIILYEMVTGRPPFEAETPMAVMMKHMTQSLPLPRELNPNIPEPIELVILKALAKDPQARYQSVSELLEALQQTMLEEPTLISPAETTLASTPKPTLVSPPAKRRPWLWPVVGSIVLLVVIGVLALFVLGQGGEEGPTEAESLADIGIQATPTPPESDPETAPATPVKSEAPSSGTSGLADTSTWTHFSNTRGIKAIALQGDLIWTGSDGGLVAWNRHDGSYQKYTTLDGVPYHTIETLLVDQDGNLWAGTEMEGVIRFDGENWLAFDEDNGLPSDNVQALFQAGDGTLMAGTHYASDAISIFDGGDWSTPDWIVPDLPPMPVEFPKPVVFLEDEEGRLMIGLTDEGGLLYTDGAEWLHFTTADGLPSDSINSMTLDSENNLWVVTGQRGGIGTFDGETFTPIATFTDILGTILYTAPDGILWLGTTDDGGLWRFDGQELSHYTNDEGLPSGSIRGIAQDDEGILWLGIHEVGLVKFDGQNFETWAIENEPPFNKVQQILETDDGRLWFVEKWGDEVVAIYDPGADTWDTFKVSDSDTNALAFSPDGTRWFGTSDGLWRVDSSGARQHFTTNDGLPDDAITSLVFDSIDDVWIGMENGLVYHNPNDSEVPWRDFTDHIPSPYVQTLYTDPNGNVWVGTMQSNDQPAGVARADEGAIYDTWTLNQPFPEELDIVEAFAMDAENQLWMGTWADNTWQLEASGEWRRFDSNEGAPSSEILSIVAHPDGTVWFGTWYSGLWGYHPDKGWWQLRTDDGLPGLAVFGNYVASDGTLWVGTEGGIARYGTK
ncbi:two-component regulator propeller domain-containing protein, partial [Chloroflexota bacterium]